ncbi:MAG: lamin tail domain-containing protein [bacterium]
MKWIFGDGQIYNKLNFKKGKLYLLISVFGLSLLLFTFLPIPIIPGNCTRAIAKLYINEFMADNDNTIEDPDESGAFEDWIEIYNSGSSTVNMGGMYLTDDPNDPTQWQVPAGVSIPAHGYLLFWADNDEEEGNTHTNFGLNKAGEQILLLASDHSTVLDSIKFAEQMTDVSYGRYPDGSSSWGFMIATPGAQNSQHNTPPQITGLKHTPNIPDESEQVWVTCTVTDDGILSNVRLLYNAGNGFVSVLMKDDGTQNDGSSGDGLFGAKIPAFSKDTVVNYYVTATDSLGSQAMNPATAPDRTYSYAVGYVAPPLYINEFMADNDSVIADPNDPNSFEDWIELYNAGENSIDLGGMYITDDLTNSTKWQIPSGITIPSGGYLFFWADNDDEEGSTHTNFNLNKDGEQIGLFDRDTRGNMLIDEVVFGEQIIDISYGRLCDGEEPWVFFEDSTPGYSNTSPAGTYNYICRFSQTTNSYSAINKICTDPSSINFFDAVSGMWYSAYPFWDKPSGQNFSIETDQNYIISIISF